MQKVINVLAVVSFGISAAIVAGGVTVYVQREAIISGIKDKATEEIMSLIPEMLPSLPEVPEIPGGAAVNGLSVPGLSL